MCTNQIIVYANKDLSVARRLYELFECHIGHLREALQAGFELLCLQNTTAMKGIDEKLWLLYSDEKVPGE